MTTPALTAYHLRVTATATGPLELRQHTGASLRGALYNTLWGRFCTMPEQRSCPACPLHTVCPVASLMEPLRPHSPDGANIPRPFAIRPPTSPNRTFGPGEQFTFGITMIGASIQLFPYLALALNDMGRYGVGRRVAENDWERGRFVIEQIAAVNLLTGEIQVVQVAGSTLIHLPNLPISWADAEAQAQTLPQDRIRLRFLTPLRLIQRDAARQKSVLVTRPLLDVLVQRLAERHDRLAREYGGIPLGRERTAALTARAAEIRLLVDATHWEDVSSFSGRKGRRTPIGGLIGEALYAGDLRELLPLLLWGSVIQAGKDTTKGNGVYEVIAA
ncbi:MAG: hypothetical protein KatS3mg057_1498 [Herpetosiphonaceae bacterium]|nr:MAG: hypothetical protein KatS3mg057_1498 [Herpetosiphonaceae bacterium]